MSIEIVDGEPKVEWVPKMNRWTGAEIQAVLKGAATLGGEWKAVEGVSAAEKAAMRFFKVVVEVQWGADSSRVGTASVQQQVVALSMWQGRYRPCAAMIAVMDTKKLN